jgi:hypothetical protein
MWVVRYKATHREGTTNISEWYNCAVTVKGVYIPEGRRPNPGERKLYVAHTLTTCTLSIHETCTPSATDVRVVPHPQVSPFACNRASMLLSSVAKRPLPFTRVLFPVFCCVFCCCVVRYLLVEGPTEINVQKAQKEIIRLLEETTMQTGFTERERNASGGKYTVV